MLVKYSLFIGGIYIYSQCLRFLPLIEHSVDFRNELDLTGVNFGTPLVAVISS